MQSGERSSATLGRREAAAGLGDSEVDGGLGDSEVDGVRFIQAHRLRIDGDAHTGGNVRGCTCRRLYVPLDRGPYLEVGHAN